MKSKILAMILIPVIMLIVFPMEIHAVDSYRIVKILGFQGGATSEINVKQIKDSVTIRDEMGRDHTPDGEAIKGYKIEAGCYVDCGKAINVALQRNSDKIFWMNYDTSIQVKDGYISIIKGKIYIEAKGISPEFMDNVINLRFADKKTTVSELYLEAGGEDERIAYLFEGSINLGSCIINKQTPLAKIDDGKIKSYKLDEAKKYFGNLTQAMAWRENIKGPKSFWLKRGTVLALVGSITSGVTFAMLKNAEKDSNTSYDKYKGANNQKDIDTFYKQHVDNMHKAEVYRNCLAGFISLSGISISYEAYRTFKNRQYYRETIKDTQESGKRLQGSKIQNLKIGVELANNGIQSKICMGFD